MAGERLSSFDPIGREHRTHRESSSRCSRSSRFPGSDPVLGPEMRSTGEVMGIDADFDAAFSKALIAGGIQLPQVGNRVRVGEGRRQGITSFPPSRRWSNWVSR
jgi:carbamoyl-phosphate synthase large subunit